MTDEVECSSTDIRIESQILNGHIEVRRKVGGILWSVKNRAQDTRQVLCKGK